MPLRNYVASQVLNVMTFEMMTHSFKSPSNIHTTKPEKIGMRKKNVRKITTIRLNFGFNNHKERNEDARKISGQHDRVRKKGGRHSLSFEQGKNSFS